MCKRVLPDSSCGIIIEAADSWDGRRVPEKRMLPKSGSSVKIRPPFQRGGPLFGPEGPPLGGPPFDGPGGPLFFGKKVVGVNTQGLSKSENEGLNFAVHFSEVKKFLK